MIHGCGVMAASGPVDEDSAAAGLGAEVRCVPQRLPVQLPGPRGAPRLLQTAKEPVFMLGLGRPLDRGRGSRSAVEAGGAPPAELVPRLPAPVERGEERPLLSLFLPSRGRRNRSASGVVSSLWLRPAGRAAQQLGERGRALSSSSTLSPTKNRAASSSRPCMAAISRRSSRSLPTPAPRFAVSAGPRRRAQAAPRTSITA
jgi:hypothetical protein